ncbi:MAG: RNA polymerase sigma factor [Coriobacteriia bacterium]|nr:RNA polymerase sigma factor [Coriobacteriia bacterium]MBN2822961.1 RNA polymerase sigma factor [Coriobacteriia bacterium]
MTGSSMNQAELIQAAANDDEGAFSELVRQNADAVYGHALRFFGDKTTAEDATQEVFLKVFRSLATFDHRSGFSTWLYRVTRNVCLDMLRSKARQPQPMDPLDLSPAPVSDFANTVTDQAAVEQAMRALSPEDRAALDAVTLFDLSYEQAAEVLGVPKGTVKSRVFRARRILVSMLIPDESKTGGA